MGMVKVRVRKGMGPHQTFGHDAEGRAARTSHTSPEVFEVDESEAKRFADKLETIEESDEKPKGKAKAKPDAGTAEGATGDGSAESSGQ